MKDIRAPWEENMESRQIKSEGLHAPGYTAIALGALRRTSVWTFAILGAIAGTIASATIASAATLYVGDCQPSGRATVQDAVDAAAANGDTIFVCPGTYPGLVTINGKNLTLQGTTAKGSNVYPTLVYPEGEHPECNGDNCSQIYVEDATVTITKLNIDGLGFNEFCQSPNGIELNDASGTITNTNITNHVSACESDVPYGGYGIFAINTKSENHFTVTISNNTISDFGYEGISVSGFYQTNLNLTGKITNNTITQTDLAGVGIDVENTNKFTVSSNTITFPATQIGANIGLNFLYDQNLTASLNTATGNNFGVFGGQLTSATLNFNTISKTGIAMDLGITTSSVGFNQMTGNGPTSQAGILFGGDHNTIVLNVFNDFCAGILGDPAADDTTVDYNIFENIGPGTDIMNVQVCP